MKNRNFKTLYKECAERNITKEEMASLHLPNKSVFVGIDTTQHLSKDEVNLFVDELNRLGVPAKNLNEQNNTSLIFIDETNNFDLPENKAVLNEVIKLIKNT